MKYALGNMLNGAGGLNPDGLALDLQFAADKTLTARKGPSPILTRGSTGTFVGSNGLIQTAAVNAARFDHDPVSPFACRGLLIEEGRTNLLQYSEIFNEAASSNYWDSATANAVTSNQTTSPDGAVTADLLTTSTTAFDCFVRRAINWVGSTQYSYSIFLKRGPSNHRYVGLYIGAGITGALQYPYFDFDNPTTVQIPSGAMVGTINSTRVDAYPNGWYRVSVTFTTAATPVTVYGGVYVATSNGTLPSTPAAGLDCYIWGIQAETGSFPTSYIPTTTNTAARAADVCSITAPDFATFYNQPEGTFFADVTPLAVDQNAFVFGVNTTSFNSSHGIYKINATVSAPGRRWVGTTINVSGQAEIVTSTDDAVSRSRLAYAYKINDYAFAYAGGIVGIDTSATVPSPTAMRIGSRDDGRAINGHLAAVRYYKKRLPNAKLASITV